MQGSAAAAVAAAAAAPSATARSRKPTPTQVSTEKGRAKHPTQVLIDKGITPFIGMRNWTELRDPHVEHKCVHEKIAYLDLPMDVFSKDMHWGWRIFMLRDKFIEAGGILALVGALIAVLIIMPLVVMGRALGFCRAVEG